MGLVVTAVTGATAWGVTGLTGRIQIWGRQLKRCRPSCSRMCWLCRPLVVSPSNGTCDSLRHGAGAAEIGWWRRWLRQRQRQRCSSLCKIRLALQAATMVAPPFRLGGCQCAGLRPPPLASGLEDSDSASNAEIAFASRARHRLKTYQNSLIGWGFKLIGLTLWSCEGCSSTRALPVQLRPWLN